MYIDILGFSNLIKQNVERIKKLFKIIDILNAHKHNAFKTITFSDTLQSLFAIILVAVAADELITKKKTWSNLNANCFRCWSLFWMGMLPSRNGLRTRMQKRCRRYPEGESRILGSTALCCHQDRRFILL